MKKFFTVFAAIAFVAASLVSCNKEFENPQLGISDVNFTISGKVDPTLTKTYIEEQGNTYLAHWSAVADEKLGLVFDSVDENSTSTAFDASDITNDIAIFSGTASLALGNHTIHPFYPATAFNKGYKSGKIGLTLNVNQYPFTTSFDPAADIMIGGDQVVSVVDANTDGNPDEVLIEDIVFTRPMAVIRLHLVAKDDQAKAYGETVTSVEMNVPGQASSFALTGSLSYTPDDATYEWNTKNSMVKAIYDTAHNNADQVLIDTDDDNNSVYLVVNPATIPSGTIEFTIETDVHNGVNAITRTVNVPSGGMEFLACKVNEINLTVRDKDVPDVVADTRILVEGFDNCTSAVKDHYANFEPSETGVFGTGVTNDLAYTYSTTQMIRVNSNGKSSSDPFMWMTGSGASLTISNIAISNLNALNFSAYVKKAGTLNVQYKASSASEWTNAGSVTGTTAGETNSFNFNISNTITSIDLKLVAGAQIVVDDIVLSPGTVQEKVATPTFTVAEGTYDTAQSVEIQCTTDGATIHYTVDGNDPTTASAEYTGAINVSSTTTIKAIAVKDGMTDSEIASATYTINGSTPPAADSWVLTDLADLKAGDVFVIVGGTTVALPHNDGTSSSPDQVSVTVANNEITSTVTDAMKWNVSGNSTDGYTFYPNGSTTTWLYCNTTASSSSNDNIRVGTGARKVWELNNSGYLVTKDTYTTRYLSLNGTSDWRSYVNTNTNPQVISFYKYTINDGKSDAEVTLSYSGGTITYGDDPVQLTLTNPHGVAVTCSADPAGVVTVTNTGLATIVGAGTTTITASWDEQTVSSVTYRAGSTTYELTVAKATPVITAFNNPTTSVAVGSTVTNITTISNGLTITYTSSKTDVATVNASGVVTGIADGTSVISATFAGNDNFNAATPQTYTITVGNGGVSTPEPIVITPDSGFLSSYGSKNAFDDATLEGYAFKVQQVANYSSKIQWRAAGNTNGTGTLYNVDAMPAGITSIVIVYNSSDSSKNCTVQIGSSENPNSATSITPTTSGNTYTFAGDGSSTYFVITNGSGAGYMDSITINFD